MIKTLIAGLCFLAIAGPAYAGTGCLDADRTALEAEITAMPAGAEKDAAIAEWDMSTAAKTANNPNECDSRMQKARDHVGKK